MTDSRSGSSITRGVSSRYLLQRMLVCPREVLDVETDEITTHVI
jgi:hypothetical protein